MLYIDIKPTLISIATHRSFRGRTEVYRGNGGPGPRLIVVRELARVHLDLVDDRRDLLLPSAVLRVVAVLGPLLSCTVREEQRLERRDAPADDTDVGFNSSPDPNLVSLPCGIVRLEECVVHPVGSEAAGNDNDTADGEQNDESDALSPWQ